MISRANIDPHFGFKLKQTIDFEVQQKIVSMMRNSGVDHSLIHGSGIPAMKLLHVRMFDINDPKIWQKQILEVEHDDDDIDDLIYINRANFELDWQWTDHPISQLVKPEIEKIAHMFDWITRVTVLVSDLNTSVPFHKEWMYGNRYDCMDIPANKYFQNKSLPVVDYETSVDPEMHRNQNYYACKFPLTSVQGDNGNSMLKYNDGEVVKYFTSNHAFCLNEIAMCHGVYPTEFHRGVIYVDGKIKLDELRNNFHSELEQL